jgi:hypothetical protein
MLTHTNLVTNLRQFVRKLIATYIGYFTILWSLYTQNNPNVAVTRNFDETGQQERLIGLLPFFHSIFRNDKCFLLHNDDDTIMNAYIFCRLWFSSFSYFWTLSRLIYNEFAKI